MTNSVELAILDGDITAFDADVVALKYAQDFHGADAHVARLLGERGVSMQKMRPAEGKSAYLDTRGAIRARHVLFMGTIGLYDLRYRQIGQLAADTLAVLAEAAPETRHLAMTIHGPGYGLDEIEAVLAQIAGLVESLDLARRPTDLQRISIVEIVPSRVQRLKQYLRALPHLTGASGRWTHDAPASSPSSSTKKQPQPIDPAGADSDAKALAFVAMPFGGEDAEDRFYLGIQEPVWKAHFRCERIDQEFFTGSILDRIKSKIADAEVVIADLTGANPNVFLEVGYAWAKEVPTILVIDSEEKLRFDVIDQRCLKFTSIRNLKELLKNEIRGLIDADVIKRS